MAKTEATAVLDRLENAQAEAEAAHAAAVAAESKFAELTARIERGGNVTASEFGEAQLAAKLAAIRAKSASERAAQEAEAQRLDRVDGFGNYAAKELDRSGYDAAKEQARAALVNLFGEMGAYNGRHADLADELSRLIGSSNEGRSHMYFHGARVTGVSGIFEATGKSFQRIDTGEATMTIVRDAFREAFPREGFPG